MLLIWISRNSNKVPTDVFHETHFNIWGNVFHVYFVIITDDKEPEFNLKTQEELIEYVKDVYHFADVETAWTEANSFSENYTDPTI